MKPLIAEELHKDPRIIEAKHKILEIYSEYQKKLNGITPAQSDRKVVYDELIKLWETQRGAPLWHHYLGSGFGNGALVELADGSVKYDLISGIGVHWGHGQPELVKVLLDAALSDKVMQGNLQQNVDTVELSTLILKQVHLEHIFFTNSGAMACENAIKVIFQKKFPATRLLAFEHCFMGRTLAMSQITDKAIYREGLPINLHIDYIPFFDPMHPLESTRQAVRILQSHLKRYPKQHAAMICELIQGEGGVNVGNSEFFIALFDVLKENGIAIFVDEVQSFGRTPKLFAFQYYDLDAYVDVVTIGKISQVCATLFSKDYRPLPGLLSQTFTSSTSAIHASTQIIKSLLEEGYLGQDGKINQLHSQFSKQLDKIAKNSKGLIKGPFGIGSILAFTPFNGEKEKVIQLAKALFEAGIIVFTAGENPTRIRSLLPVGGIKFEDIDLICSLIERTLMEVSRS